MQSPKQATEVTLMRHFEIDDRLKQNLAYHLPRKFFLRTASFALGPQAIKWLRTASSAYCSLKPSSNF